MSNADADERRTLVNVDFAPIAETTAWISRARKQPFLLSGGVEISTKPQFMTFMNNVTISRRASFWAQAAHVRRAMDCMGK